ncbi:PspC domain-containing protein [Streptomyces sp. 549]|uniref:PspC domain-containing protein n=1 Tax=Streptomyces sp. 549 TaxID=3049076 RepID=UPI0024C42580|nr:PspC domain-containing protein [Streptomyces sp. 549]MDK1472803.1 PspC domain-containing protein [Streptomyces sp. 549]
MTKDQEPAGTASARRAAASESPPPARLERSARHKVVAGVCGGLGRHFGVDPVIFRVPLAVLSVIGGLGLLFYGFAWLLVPLEGEDENEGRRMLSGRVEGSSLAAVLCALAGSGLVLASLGSSRSITFSLLVAVAVGAAVHWARNRQGEVDDGHEPPPAAPPEAQAPPVPSSPSWWRGTAAAGDGYLWGPEDAQVTTVPGGAPMPVYTATKEVVRSPRERSIGGLVCLSAMLATGLVAALSWSAHPLGTVLVLGLSAGLAVLGLGLTVSAFVGRTGAGTVLVVLMTAGLLTAATVVPKTITTDWMDTTWAPTRSDQVLEEYHVGTGRSVLDLSGLRLGEDEKVATTLQLGAGEAVVRVPENMTLDLELKIGAGGYRLPSQRYEGGDDGTVHGGGLGLNENYTIEPRGEQPARGTVRLRLDVGVGEVVVEQVPVTGPGDEAGDGTGDEAGSGSGEEAGSGAGPESVSGAGTRDDAARGTAVSGSAAHGRAAVGSERESAE